MTASRQQARMRLSVALLCWLITVPIALSGHHHQATHTTKSDACATCLATRLSPVVSPPPLPHIAPFTHYTAVTVRPVAVRARHQRSPKSGRAPPALTVDSAAV